MRDRFPCQDALLATLAFVPSMLAAGNSANAQTPPAARPEPVASKPAMSEAGKAIRAAEDAFTAEYNRGDGKALAARFTEDAEVEEADGRKYRGRDEIEKEFVSTFAAIPGAKISVEIDAIRFLSPEVAKEEGRTRLLLTDGTSIFRLFSAIQVKRDGRWLTSDLREQLDPLVRPHERLQELAWMLGEWIDEGSDAVVRVDCRWSEDGSFLMRSFQVKHMGKPLMTVTQRIGWDPLARQIRSWEFDSEGGFGEGRWHRDGDRWIVKHTGVRPEGTSASSTNVFVRERPDLVRWSSLDRVIGEDIAAVSEDFVLTRVPPAPGFAPGVRAPKPPPPTLPRTPR